MKFIALFFPAFIAFGLNKKENVSLKKDWFQLIFMYCMFTIVINLSVMGIITYVLGLDGLTISVFESFSFFIIYTILSCGCSAFVGGITKILKKNIVSPTLNDVADAIKNIRADKLPEVGVVGSVGSFFQNPIVDTDVFQKLKETYPDMPSYPNENGVKIPAGWLIDKAGWKGHKENHVGVWDKQALVLVHYGDGKPEEILHLMKKIQDSVKEKFDIDIKPEVNII